jgi:choline/glycine/proline betaine transport protein
MVGGLKGLQTAAITAALPFSLVMIVMIWGLMKSLRQENLTPALYVPAKISAT